MSKWVGNAVHILAHVFESASRKCLKIWTSQFHFLKRLKDVVPPSEVCLYGHIDQSWHRLNNSLRCAFLSLFPLRQIAKSDKGLGSISMCKRDLYQSLVVPLAKRPHLESRIEAHTSGKMSAGGSVSASSLDAEKKVSHRGLHS